MTVLGPQWLASGTPVGPLAELPGGLRHVSLSHADLSARNRVSARTGPLDVEIGGHPLSLVPMGLLEHVDIEKWWDVIVRGAIVTIGLSEGLVRPVAHLPLDLGIEIALDAFLSALEDHLGDAVSISASDVGMLSPASRVWHIRWGEAEGLIALRYDARAEPLLAEVLGSLPFASPPVRDLPVEMHVRIGSYDVSGDRLRRMRPGDIFLSLRDDLSAETGTLVAGGRICGKVGLSMTGAKVVERIAPVSADDGDAVVFQLPCQPMARSDLSLLSSGETVPFASDHPGRVVLQRRGRFVGTGALIRLGDRLAVELRSLERCFAAPPLRQAIPSRHLPKKRVRS